MSLAWQPAPQLRDSSLQVSDASCAGECQYLLIDTLNAGLPLLLGFGIEEGKCPAWHKQTQSEGGSTEGVLGVCSSACVLVGWSQVMVWTHLLPLSASPTLQHCLWSLYLIPTSAALSFLRCAGGVCSA